MFRKKRQPAPFFRMPGAPFNPATGENALLQNYPSKGTVLALFQVIEEDTHDNYIACRGYEADADPEFRYLHDPYTVPTTTPINVAKPYSVRGTNPYELGQVVVAARIKGKLGYNPGKAVTVGQPADLDEEISLLTDDDDVAISWLDIGGTSTRPSFGFSAIGSLNQVSSGTIDWTGGTQFNDGDYVTNGGSLLTIAAGTPLMWFRVDWNANTQATYNPATDLHSLIALTLNGGSFVTQGDETHHRVEGINSALHTHRANHSSFFDYQLTGGDEIRMTFSMPGAPSNAATGCSASIRIIPLLGLT